MIDFSNAVEELNSYKGSEKKKKLKYENKNYLVKFPDPICEKDRNISYINNAFLEYIGSNIFKIVRFKTQTTILGTYTYNGKEKIVCACEDFVNANSALYEFETLALSVNPDKKIQTELNDIMEVIYEIENMPNLIVKENIKERFWDMFIIDALIGNKDRHNGNWGLLVNTSGNYAEFAPIYDCGSCFDPILEDAELEKMLNNEVEIKNLAINCYSCIKENGRKINYMSFISSKKNNECNNAIKRIFKKIDIEEIFNFIDKVDCISDIRKEFYKKIISIRYNIIKVIYQKIN